MRLFLTRCLTLLTCFCVLGCASFQSRFADRGKSSSDERERLLTDINARMSQAVPTDAGLRRHCLRVGAHQQI